MPIIISTIISIALIVASFNIPARWLDIYRLQEPKFGALTTISTTDRISNFPAVYNANLGQTAATNTANTWDSLQQFTRASSTQFSAYAAYFGGTATSSFSTAGALTLITPLTVANGGTGSTTLSSNQLLLGNGTGAITTPSGWGTSGQFLTSQGAGVLPQWTTSSIDQSLNYTWTGIHQFNSASSTNQGVYDIFSVGRTSSTTIRGNNLSSTLPYASTTVITSTLASTTNLIIDGNGTCVGCVNNGVGNNYQKLTGTCTLSGGSPSTCSITLTCPSGKSVVSGGSSGLIAAGAPTNAVMVDSYPSATTTWTFNFEGGNGLTDTLTGYSICLKN